MSEEKAMDPVHDGSQKKIKADESTHRTPERQTDTDTLTDTKLPESNQTVERNREDQQMSDDTRIALLAEGIRGHVSDFINETFSQISEDELTIHYLSKTMHQLAEKNHYNDPPWEKDLDAGFWNRYLTRSVSEIINEGFWACSDVATVYTAVAKS